MNDSNHDHFCPQCTLGGKSEFWGIAKHYHEPTDMSLCDGCYEIAINENWTNKQNDDGDFVVIKVGLLHDDEILYKSPDLKDVQSWVQEQWNKHVFSLIEVK